MSGRLGTAAAAAAAYGAHAMPSIAAIAPLRRAATRWTGAAAADHVALTFDDGPAATSTPQFLDTLAAAGVRATFFLLGSCVEAEPELARRIVAEGHEVGVHGWAHVPHLLQGPGAVRADIGRALAVITDVTGARPRCWRPPNGITTGGGLLAAHQLGLSPVLWTVDGHDWSRSASPQSVLARITGRLRGGDVLLLHDADTTSAPEAWRSTLSALPALLAACRERGLRVGPWREHHLAAVC
jgi:peptidoglycan/xylan/chitin deacetylase (PgdA/CDA1 family)